MQTRPAPPGRCSFAAVRRPCLIPRRGSYALDLSLTRLCRGSYALDLSLTPKSFLPAENPELAEPDRRSPGSERAIGCSAAGCSEYSALGTPDVLFPADG